MSTTTMTMSTTPLTNGRTDKSSKKQSKIIVLALQPSLLKKFKQKKDSPSIASSPTPALQDMPKLKTHPSQEYNLELNPAPSPLQDAPSPIDADKKKAPTTNGVKRVTPLPDGLPKPRGKPGPKKKPRL